MCRMLSSLALVLLSLSAVHSQFALSDTLGDHMVLQRGQQGAMVWGFDKPSASIKTLFQSNSYTATAGSDGIWRQRLPPTAAGGPYTITFSSSTGGAADLNDVMFGDVYICGGQSNQQFSVAAVTNSSVETQLANDYPNIRLFTVGQGNGTGGPFTNLQSIEQTWSVASNTSINNKNGFGYFSAVCWFFGREIFNSLGGAVPLGLISNNWGGTSVELWSDAAAYARCNRTGTGNLYNAMIVPYTTGPMAITGFTWYQGEANTGSLASAIAYSCLFPSMIQSWRTNFNNPEAYFGFVQLSTWCGNGLSRPLAQMRDAQLVAITAQPNVGYATNADWGAGCNIHPPPKQYCSFRLAASALAIQYGQTIAWRSPTYASAAQTGAGSLTVSLNDVESQGLVQIENAANNIPGTNCTALALQYGPTCFWGNLQFNDAASTWVNATVSLDATATKMILTATPPSGATSIVASAYGYGAIPFLTVYRADRDLPVLPWNRTVVA